MYGLPPPPEPVVVKTKDEHGLPLNITERTELLLRKLDRVDLTDKKELAYRVPCFLRIDADVRAHINILHEVKENFLKSQVNERLTVLQEEQAVALREERAAFCNTLRMFGDVLEQEQQTLTTCKEVHAANQGNRELQN